MGLGSTSAGKGSSNTSAGTSGSSAGTTGLENAEHRGSKQGRMEKEKHGQAFKNEDKNEHK